ncbi:MAG: hypothetical protein IJV78_03705 [Clostridia bacterium]|nr:hypothetical protein [Clostridia bacterium]
MTNQLYFDDAKEKYSQLCALVDVMSNQMAQAFDDFDGNQARKQLDVIVGYIMLEVALADNNFTVQEGAFVDQLCTTFPLLHLFDDVPPSVNWQAIAQFSDASVARQMADKLKDLAQDYVQNFVMGFSMLDAIVEDKDYLQLMIEGLRTIALAMAFVDGNGTSQEILCGTNQIIDVLVSPWRELRDIAKEL